MSKVIRLDDEAIELIEWYREEFLKYEADFKDVRPQFYETIKKSDIYLIKNALRYALNNRGSNY